MDSIIKIEFPKEFFSVQDTLECGQIFRFLPYKIGFKVFSLNKCAYCYESGDNSIIECNSSDDVIDEKATKMNSLFNALTENEKDNVISYTLGIIENNHKK